MNRALAMALLPWAGVLVASIIALWITSWHLGARLRWSRLLRLHHDQAGGVQSLSLVLAFPFFIFLMLFIVQVSHIMIGLMTIQYAAFAAARSAIVWIPTDTGNEAPNCIGMGGVARPMEEMSSVDPNWVSYRYDQGTWLGSSEKYQKIWRAAVLACMPMCPSRDVGMSSSSGDSTLTALQNLYTSATGKPSPPALRNKYGYSSQATEIEVVVFHNIKADPPLQPYQKYVITGTNQSGYWYYENFPSTTATGKYDPGTLDMVDPDAQFNDSEIGWQDPISVTVTHHFALLPGPARFLTSASSRAGSRITTNGTVSTYALSSTATLSNEGEKSVLRYVQYPFSP